MEKKRLIIDTDIGSDDAIAITSLILSKQFNIEAITTTFGNLPVINTTDNALRLVSFLDTFIPVYQGCKQSLVTNIYKSRLIMTNQENIEKEVNGQIIRIHELTLPLPKSIYKKQELHACSYLVDKLKNTEEKITLCCLGPLTNIATSLIMEPDIVNNIEAIYIMGGGINKGNRTASSEANFYDDPQAAQIVLNSGANIYLCPLEACESSGSFNSDDVLKLKSINNKISQYIAKELEDYLYRENILFNIDSDTIYDYAAIVPLINKNSIIKMNKANGNVDCNHGLADGTLIIDYRVYANKKYNINLIEQIDANIAHNLLFDLLNNYEK